MGDDLLKCVYETKIMCRLFKRTFKIIRNGNLLLFHVVCRSLDIYTSKWNNLWCLEEYRFLLTTSNVGNIDQIITLCETWHPFINIAFHQKSSSERSEHSNGIGNDICMYYIIWILCSALTAHLYENVYRRLTLCLPCPSSQSFIARPNFTGKNIDNGHLEYKRKSYKLSGLERVQIRI